MLEFVNQTPQDVYISYMFFSPDVCGQDGDWQAIGWFHASSGQSVVVYGDSMKDVDHGVWCFYAHTADRQYVWDGPFSTSVPVAAYNQCYLDGTIGGAGEYEEIGFRSFATGSVDNFTMHLTL